MLNSKVNVVANGDLTYKIKTLNPNSFKKASKKFEVNVYNEVTLQNREKKVNEIDRL